MKTLSVEQIVAIHSLLIQETGGADGLRDLGRLESVVASQTQEVFGEAIYRGYPEKAAVIARSIIGDHPFVDGNKRSAMLCAITFLEINSITFTAKQGELEDFAVKVATDHLEIKEIAQWFKQHSKPSN